MVSSKGRQHGIIAGSIPCCLPRLQKRSHIAYPGTQFALPRVGNMGSDPILPSSGRQYGIGEAYGYMSMGFYNGRGVYGYRERIREAFPPPPFSFFFFFFFYFLTPLFFCIFFQGGLHAAVGVLVNGKVGLRGFGLRLFFRIES